MSKRNVSDIEFQRKKEKEKEKTSLLFSRETIDSHAKVCPKGTSLYDSSRPSLELMVNIETKPDPLPGCEAFAL